MNDNNCRTTRRAVVAGLATAPIAGLPAIGSAVSGDPVIAALADCRAAHAAYEQAPDDASGDAFHRIGEFEAELFSTDPTTRSGAMELLGYLADFLDQDGRVNDNLVGELIGDSIRAALDVFEQEAC